MRDMTSPRGRMRVVSALTAVLFCMMPLGMAQANDTLSDDASRGTPTSTRSNAHVPISTPGTYGSDASGATSSNTTITSTGKSPADSKMSIDD